LPSDINPRNVLGQYRKLGNPSFKRIIEGCFQELPSKRVNAALFAQKLLDEYNDSCAKSALRHADVEAITSAKTKCWDWLKTSREQYWRKNNDYKQVKPNGMLMETDTSILLQCLESWNEPAGLTLAPEIHFLVGAGIFWGFIDPSHVDREGPSESTRSRFCKGAVFLADLV
jgi:hypothetical protein